MRYAVMLAVLVCAGCISPTENMRQNAGAVTDLSQKFNAEGAKPNSPETVQLVKCAVTNEKILGSPKERVDVKDLAAVEATRQRAEKDAEKGGAWVIAGTAALGAGAALAAIFGLGGVAKFLRRQAENLKTYKDRADTFEEGMVKVEAKLKTSVKGAAKFMDKVDEETAEKLRDAFRESAKESDHKKEYDATVKKILNGG